MTTKLLLHFEGTPGAQTFTDSSGNGLVFTADDASPVLATAEAVFGSTGLALPTKDKGIRATWPSYLDLSGEFTIEGRWHSPSSLTGFGRFLMSDAGGVSGDHQFYLLPADGSIWLYDGVYGVSDTWIKFTDLAFTADSTHAWAITRDSSNVIRAFIDGVVSAVTATNATDWTHVGRPLQIGAADIGAGDIGMRGMDEIRISDACLYTTTYTPATSPFPDPGVVRRALYLKFI